MKATGTPSGAQCARRYRHGLAAAALGLVLHGSSWGQTPTGEAAPPPPDYLDRLIEGLPVQPDAADADLEDFDRAGAPRALRAESRLQSSSNDQGHQSAAWISVRGALDTANYGALSFDATARLHEQSSFARRGPGASFSLYQTGMPFSGGWAASQGLGVIQTLGPRLGVQQGSFFVPTRLVQGASTQWRNEGNGLTLQLSGGETGSFSSIGQGSFYGSGNRVASAGAELLGVRGGASLLPEGWSYAGSVSGASGSDALFVPGFASRSAEAASRATSQSLRWEEAGASVQGQWLASRNQDLSALVQGAPAGAQSWHQGTWVDAVLAQSEITHRAGVHRLEPHLSWLGTALGANSQGAYYRWSRQGLRDQLEVQVSSTKPVDRSTGGADLQQAGASLRQTIDQQLGVGGVVQFSHGSGAAWLASGYAELHRSWADVRLQAGFDTLEGRIVARRISSDQAWALPIGQRLSTSLALNSTREGATSLNGAPAGAFGSSLELAAAAGTDLNERLTLDLNARASEPASSQAARIYNLSATSQWRVARGWSLGTALGWSRAAGLASTATASPIPTLPGIAAPNSAPATSSRDLWITLRYDFQAGSASVPIGAGARIGAGGGNIEGVVYLDDNANGRFDALEARAANVTVTLDGRYTTRTDAQGRFEFPFVAPGVHRIAVSADTLPLPWLMQSTEPLRVEVAPRETIRIEIGATRDRISAGAD